MRTPSKLIGGLLCVAAFVFVVSDASAQLNPGFELAGPTANGATNWNTLAATGGALALVTRTNATPHSGSFDMYFESQGNGAAPNTDLRSDPIPVTFGTSYSFSFWAKNPLKLGGANPQWDIFWLDASNLPVGAPIFQSFSSVGSSYTLVTNSITITPPSAAAVKATVGWIQAVGAGTGDHWITQIDDVSFAAVPEPSTVALVGVGLLGAFFGLRKRRS
jgi:hypothetical protein